MAIKISCNMCGREMGEVPYSELKTFHKKHGEQCPDCIKMEKDLKETIDKKRQFWHKKFDMLAKECRDQMMDDVKNLLEERARKQELEILRREDERMAKIIGSVKEEEKKKQDIINEYKNKQSEVKE